MSLHFYRKRIKRTLIFISTLFLVIFITWGINQSIMPYLKSIATYQVRSYVNTLLRECVDENFVGVSKSEGSYDVVMIRAQLAKLVEDASVILERSSDTEVIYELPLGTLTQNMWLINFGPKIPVKMRMLQEVQGEVISEVVEYGLNNALISIYIILNVQVEVLAPFHLDELVIQSEIPLVIDVFEGDVPGVIRDW